MFIINYKVAQRDAHLLIPVILTNFKYNPADIVVWRLCVWERKTRSTVQMKRELWHPSTKRRGGRERARFCPASGRWCTGRPKARRRSEHHTSTVFPQFSPLQDTFIFVLWLEVDNDIQFLRNIQCREDFNCKEMFEKFSVVLYSPSCLLSRISLFFQLFNFNFFLHILTNNPDQNGK